MRKASSARDHKIAGFVLQEPNPFGAILFAFVLKALSEKILIFIKILRNVGHNTNQIQIDHQPIRMGQNNTFVMIRILIKSK